MEPSHPATPLCPTNRSWYVLDRDRVVTSVSPESHPATVGAQGSNVFKAFPGLEEQIGDIVELGIGGEPSSRVVFYAGVLAHVTVIPGPGDHVTVYTERTTIAGLRTSLEKLDRWLSDGAREPGRRRLSLAPDLDDPTLEEVA